MEIKHKIDMYRFKWELDKFLEKPTKEHMTVFYGSSTFAFWKAIEEIFASKNAVNLGFGGSTADEAEYHYETYAKRFNADTLVWYFGDNEPVCDYTVDETFELFIRTWNKFRLDNPNIKIISIATKTSPCRNEYKDFVIALNAKVKALAEISSWLTYIETKDICYDKDGNYILENYMEDQLHFSPKGYAKLKEKLDRVL